MEAFKISPACTSCQDCVEVCPTFSIYYGVGQYVIDTDTCHGCGICTLVCPVDAISEIVPEDSAELDKFLAQAEDDSKKK